MKTIAFDMDGVLVDSNEAILFSLDTALKQHNLPTTPTHLRSRIVGPPLATMVQMVLGGEVDPSLLESITKSYRSINDSDGLALTRVFPGVEDALAQLNRDFRLVVATSKSAKSAIRLLTHLGLSSYFELIDGSTNDMQPESKASILDRIIRKIGTVSLMIGDRIHDVEAAAHHDIKTLCVTWGFAPEGELENSGAIRVIDDMSQLVSAIKTLT